MIFQNPIALQTARIAVRDNRESASKGPSSLGLEQTWTNPVAPAVPPRAFQALALDIDDALRKLQEPTSREPEHLWEQVDETRDAISVVAMSLRAHEDSPQKDLVMNQLRNLEQRLVKFVFVEFGVRRFELARLPYWEPPRMLNFDPMHLMPESFLRHRWR